MSEMFDRVFTRDYLVQWLYVGTALLVLVFGSIWWTKVYENPYNVYWGMLNNSLTTSAVTKHVTEDQQGTDLNQYIALDFGTHNLAYAKTTLRNTNGTAVTDNVGDLQHEYLRYTAVKQSKSVKGQNFAAVLGKWAEIPASNSSSTSSSVPFFTQIMLGLGFEGGNIVPIANLSDSERSALISELHTSVVFQTSFKNVKRQMVHGRPVYTYSVNVEPVAYVAFEQAFAQDLGIKALQNISPNSSQGDPAMQVQFHVDAWSHQLVGITYPGTNDTETYSSYGVPTNISIPKMTISNSKFESLISGVQ